MEGAGDIRHHDLSHTVDRENGAGNDAMAVVRRYGGVSLHQWLRIADASVMLPHVSNTNTSNAMIAEKAAA